jgi:hypothetical protein
MAQQLGDYESPFSYGPNLAPSDFHLFGVLKKHLAGKQMAKHTNIEQNVIFWL